MDFRVQHLQPTALPDVRFRQLRPIGEMQRKKADESFPIRNQAFSEKVELITSPAIPASQGETIDTDATLTRRVSDTD
jgi:hypothetical protein